MLYTGNMLKIAYSLFYFVSTAFSTLVYSTYKAMTRKWLKTINFAQK